jgi:hypothetical protein
MRGQPPLGGTKLMPHKHPEDRVSTVMSGVFYIGLGEEFDGDNVTAFPRLGPPQRACTATVPRVTNRSKW